MIASGALLCRRRHEFVAGRLGEDRRGRLDRLGLVHHQGRA